MTRGSCSKAGKKKRRWGKWRVKKHKKSSSPPTRIRNQNSSAGVGRQVPLKPSHVPEEDSVLEESPHRMPGVGGGGTTQEDG